MYPHINKDVRIVLDCPISFYMGGNMKKKGLVLFVVCVFFVLTTFSCKSNSETDLISQQKAERTAGKTSKTISKLIKSVYQASFKVNSNSNKSNELANVSNYDCTYNSSTGWWTVDFNFGLYKMTLHIQHQDKNAHIQKYYTSKTNKVFVNGKGSGLGINFEIEWIMSNMKPYSKTYTINGTGTLEVDGQSVSIALKDTKIMKSGTVPLVGTLSIELNGINFEINYDGKELITLTYIYDGTECKIVINILTGEVTQA
jgi:hypothetical protein